MRLRLLLLLLWCAVVLLLSASTHAEHTPQLQWMRGYTSAGGMSCCSERDCRRMPVSLVAFVDDKALVEIRGIQLVLPAKSVHNSEDEDTWWCCKADGEGNCPLEPSQDNTRCAFFATGG